MAVFLAALMPGDTIMGLDLAHGGHLTHGMKLNFSGKYFKVVHYGVDPKSHRINMDEVARLSREHKPKLIIGGAMLTRVILISPRFTVSPRMSGR